MQVDKGLLLKLVKPLSLEIIYQYVICYKL